MLKYVMEFGYQIRVCHTGKTALLSSIFENLLIQLKPSSERQKLFLSTEIIKVFPRALVS